MDIFADVSIEWFRILAWVGAAACAGAVLLWRWRRPDVAALAAAAVVMAANAGAGIYVLNHPGDGRWAGDAQAKLDPPSFAETPMVGQFLEPLDGVLNGIAGGINDFVDFRAALAVALDFFGTAGWSLAVLMPLGVVVMVVNAVLARRRNARAAAAVTELARLRAEVELLKRHVGYPGGNPVHDII